jgi:hypothetical protein
MNNNTNSHRAVLNSNLISFLPSVSLTGVQIYMCVCVILPLIKEGTTKGKYGQWLTQAALLSLSSMYVSLRLHLAAACV